jgi:hypothetical protein
VVLFVYVFVARFSVSHYAWCKDVTVGDVLSRRISGGQAKRTNIGRALNPNPTSENIRNHQP